MQSTSYDMLSNKYFFFERFLSEGFFIQQLFKQKQLVFVKQERGTSW